MKTGKEVVCAMLRVVEISTQPGLSDDQYTVLAGMATALGWVSDDPDMACDDGVNVLDRLLLAGKVWTPEEN